MDSFTCPNSSSEHRRCSRLEPSVPTGDRRSPTELVVGGVNAPLPIWARLLAKGTEITRNRNKIRTLRW